MDFTVFVSQVVDNQKYGMVSRPRMANIHSTNTDRYGGGGGLLNHKTNLNFLRGQMYQSTPVLNSGLEKSKLAVSKRLVPI